MSVSEQRILVLWRKFAADRVTSGLRSVGHGDVLDSGIRNARRKEMLVSPDVEKAKHKA